jgi:hypothetical protein
LLPTDNTKRLNRTVEQGVALKEKVLGEDVLLGFDAV